MTGFRALSLAGICALSASLMSTAHADTVGCDCSYTSHEAHKPAHWEKVVKDMRIWTATHEKHHPYYYTMQKKLVSAEYNWKMSKDASSHKNKHHKHHKHHHWCKDDVSPS